MKEWLNDVKVFSQYIIGTRVRRRVRKRGGPERDRAFSVKTGLKSRKLGRKRFKTLSKSVFIQKKSLNFENFLIKTCTPYFFAVSLQRSFKVHLG